MQKIVLIAVLLSVAALVRGQDTNWVYRGNDTIWGDITTHSTYTSIKCCLGTICSVPRKPRILNVFRRKEKRRHYIPCK